MWSFQQFMAFLHRAVFSLVAEHAVEVPAEISVARGADGGDKVDRRGVAVATEVETFIVEAVVAREGDFWRDAALLQSHERLRYLEGGARRVCTHDGAVEERTHGVAAQLLMVFSTVAPHREAGGRRWAKRPCRESAPLKVRWQRWRRACLRAGALPGPEGRGRCSA